MKKAESATAIAHTHCTIDHSTRCCNGDVAAGSAIRKGWDYVALKAQSAVRTDSHVKHQYTCAMPIEARW